MRVKRLLICWTVLSMIGLAAPACSPSSESEQGIDTKSYFFDLVPWLLEGDRWFLIDTATPRTLVLPSAANIALDIGGVEPVVTEHLPERVRAAAGPALGGILGADALLERPFLLDPLRRELTFGPDLDALFAGTPYRVLPAIRAGKGGTCLSEGECIDFQASRIILAVDLEGVPSYALLDTGATFVNVQAALFDRLPARADRPLLRMRGSEGPRVQSRIAALTAGAIEKSNVNVAVLYEDDAAFARLRVETGYDIEVLLGHSFLQDFALAVDPYAPSVALAKYDAPPDLVPERWVSSGLAYTAERECYRVILLAEQHSAASSGIVVGDCVTAIDELRAGRDPLSKVYARERTLPVGTVVEISVKREDGEHVHAVTIEDLLPSL